MISPREKDMLCGQKTHHSFIHTVWLWIASTGRGKVGHEFNPKYHASASISDASLVGPVGIHL